MTTDNDTPADVAALAEALHNTDACGYQKSHAANVCGICSSMAYRYTNALPEGWHLSNRAEAGAESGIATLLAVANQRGAEVLALRAALDIIRRCVLNSSEAPNVLDADGIEAGGRIAIARARAIAATIRAILKANTISAVAVDALANTAQEAQRITKDIEAPWREALERLAQRHDWDPNAGRCICGPHGMARALLGGE
jgi:hypothetical protein